MIPYKFQIHTTTAAMPSWEHDTTFVSLEMAKDYGARLVRQMAGVRWFMYLLVWDMRDKSLVAQIRLVEPQAHFVE